MAGNGGREGGEPGACCDHGENLRKGGGGVSRRVRKDPVRPGPDGVQSVAPGRAQLSLSSRTSSMAKSMEDSLSTSMTRPLPLNGLKIRAPVAARPFLK